MARCVLLKVHGKVQGVGYRYFVSKVAARHGISGRVRNIPDGSVEIFAVGGGDSIDAFVRDIDVDVPGGMAVMNIEREEMDERELAKRGFDLNAPGFAVE